jgi:hypothetical protein
MSVWAEQKQAQANPMDLVKAFTGADYWDGRAFLQIRYGGCVGVNSWTSVPKTVT